MDDECDDVSNYDDDDDYMYYDNDDNDECDYLSMQAQFDNVDLPAGVEATVSWLNEPAPSSKASSQFSSSIHLAGAQTSNSTLLEHASSSFAQVPASSSSLVSGGSNSCGKEEATEDELMKKYHSFKHFDVVEDFSDHHYSNLGIQGQQVTCKGISCALQVIFCYFSCLLNHECDCTNLCCYFLNSHLRPGVRKFRMSGKYWKMIYLVSQMLLVSDHLFFFWFVFLILSWLIYQCWFPA